MIEALQWYAGMSVLTALFLFADVRPRGIGEWLGLTGIALVWPVAFGFALYSAMKALRA